MLELDGARNDVLASAPVPPSQAMTYREDPRAPLRIVTTRMRFLPEPLRAALRAAKPGRPHATAEGPPAVALSTARGPGLALLGAGLSAFFSFATYMNLRGIPTNEDIVRFAAGAFFASALVALALLLAARWLAPIPFRAVIAQPDWLLCMRGDGDRVDAIPLVMVERVVPGERSLDVLLREGGTRRYPYRFAIADAAFFDVARSIVALAQRPADATLSALREVAPRSWAVSTVAALVVGLLVSVPLTAFGARAVVLQRYGDDVHGIERDLADSRTFEDPAVRRTGEVSGHQWFVDVYGPVVEEDGIACAMLQHWTDFDTRWPAERDALAAAQATADDAATAEALAEVERFRDFPQHLRDLARRHEGTVVAERALAAIPEALRSIRARRAAEGASPASLALCDAVSAAANRAPPVGFDLLSAVDDSLTRTSVPDGSSIYAGSAVATAVATIPAGLQRGTSDAFDGAYGAPLSPRPEGIPGLVVTVRLRVGYGDGGYVYTTPRPGTHGVTGGESYPALVVDGTVHFEDARTSPPTVLEVPVSTTTPDELPMAPEHMAERYPSSTSLYESFGEGLGRSVAAVIARTLCLE